MGLPNKYDYVGNCSYNQHGVGLEDVKPTLWNIYADNLACSS